MDILDCRVKAQKWSDKYNNNAYIFENDSGYNFTYCQTKETIIIITPSYKSMKEINGHKYSKKYFPNYKVRYRVEFDVIGQDYKSNLDIYSTNEDEKTVFEVIGTMINKVVVSDYRVIHKSSKQSDDNSGKLIEEMIKIL